MAHKAHGKWKAYLAEHNISLNVVANILGISANSVSLKNNGHQNYTIEEVNTLADHYGISMDLFKFEAGEHQEESK